MTEEQRLEAEVFLKVGEFIRQTADQVENMRNAIMELAKALSGMNYKLDEICKHIKDNK